MEQRFQTTLLSNYADKRDPRESCAIIIPTHNASKHWPALHQGLRQQGFRDAQIIIIDSSSTDDTQVLVEQAGYRLVVIPKASFGHGCTRQMAALLVPDAEFLVYLTQDAVPLEDSVSRLLQTFDDPQIGAVYGRQIARQQANAIERHGRVFNYPDSSAIRTFESRKSLGFRSAYFSNSFAAYRRCAFEQVGGFPGSVIVSEDVSVAARMLLKGWSIGYCAEAVAIHSHDLTLTAEFARYFDIAIHHEQERWIIEQFGSVGGEGLRFVYSELRYLAVKAPHLIPLALLRGAIKWTAYRLGRSESHLALWLKPNFSTLPISGTSRGTIKPHARPSRKLTS